VDYDVYYTKLTEKFKERSNYQPPNRKIEEVTLPGVIVEVLVKPGDVIKAGEPLYILDAMKMHNTFRAKFGGEVKKVNVNPGDRVIKKFPIIEYK
jgi:biotin carboxyl carrier protein